MTQANERIHPTVLRLAQRIQFIEHGGRHTWETCMQTARDRAIEQAQACLTEMNLIFKGCFLADDNSNPPQLWVWRGEPGDETAEAWQRVTRLE